jgi:hypothetical protein
MSAASATSARETTSFAARPPTSFSLASIV